MSINNNKKIKTKNNAVLCIIKQYKSKIIALALLYLISALTTISMPQIMSIIVDKGIKTQNFEIVITYSGVMAILAILSFISLIVTAKINSIITTSIGCDLRQKLFSKINDLSVEQFTNFGTSSLLTRSTDNIFMIEETVQTLVYTVVTVPILIIGGIVLSCISNILLSVVIFSVAPLAIFGLISIVKKLENLWELSNKYIDDQNKLVRERLTGIRVIRAFNREQTEHQKIKSATENMSINIIRANIFTGYINPITVTLFNIAVIAIIIIGGNFVSFKSDLTAGQIFSAIQYITIISGGMLVAFWTIIWIPKLKVYLARINQVLDTKVIIKPENEHSNKNLVGDISIKDLSFRYPNGGANVLNNINLQINKGEKIAFVGGSGSGKSTLIKLILGFYSNYCGSISLHDIDYCELTEKTIRSNIAVTLQKSMIFEGSILDNIKISNPNASMETIEKCVEIAQIKQFINSNKDGYNYVLNGGGTNISGGQKQRINIARTILKDANTYIFDDSFSALDFLTESRLRKQLDNHLTGKTQIIVTQRISTAKNCDKIYVFDNGSIVGFGDNKSLIESCEVYKQIYKSQVGGDLGGVINENI